MPNSFAINLRVAREKKGLTKAEVAARMGFTGTWYARLEGGEENLAPDTIPRLALALNLSPDMKERLGAEAQRSECKLHFEMTVPYTPIDALLCQKFRERIEQMPMKEKKAMLTWIDFPNDSY